LISRSCWKTCFTMVIFQGVFKFGNLKTASKHEICFGFYWKTNKEESCKSNSDRVVFLLFIINHSISSHKQCKFICCTINYSFAFFSPPKSALKKVNSEAEPRPISSFSDFSST
jgi:hypothetical protein